MADAASYMCVAENPAGSAEKLFTLRVQGGLSGWLLQAPQLGRGWAPGLLQATPWVNCAVRLNMVCPVSWARSLGPGLN